MLNFTLWLETDNENEWRRLFDYALTMYKKGPFENPHFHDNIVRLLRNVNLEQEANELEMIRPSEEDVKFANTPMYGISAMTIGNAMDHKEKRTKEKSFRAAHRAYMDALENIMDKIHAKSISAGWPWVN